MEDCDWFNPLEHACRHLQTNKQLLQKMGGALTAVTHLVAEDLLTVQQHTMTFLPVVHFLQGSHRNYSDGIRCSVPLEAIPGMMTLCMNTGTSNTHLPSFSGVMKAFSRYMQASCSFHLWIQLLYCTNFEGW